MIGRGLSEGGKMASGGRGLEKQVFVAVLCSERSACRESWGGEFWVGLVGLFGSEEKSQGPDMTWGCCFGDLNLSEVGGVLGHL